MDSQRGIVDGFARRTNNTILHWYEDPDRPRWKASQSSKLAEMVRDAQDGRFDWIVLDRQQRLGTYDHLEFFHYLHVFRMANVRIWSVAEGELTTDEIATSFRSLAGSHSEKEEQRNKAGNVARGMLLNANKGLYNGSLMPLGYDRVCVSPDGVERFRLIEEAREPNPNHVPGSKEPGEGRYTHSYTVLYPNGHSESLTQLPGKGRQDRYEYRKSDREDRVRWAREVYVLYDSGMNRSEIAKQMNRDGVDLGLRTAWTVHSVGQILTNPIYGGVVEWKKRSNPKYATVTKDGRYVKSDWNAANPRASARVIPPEDRVRSAPNEDLRIVEQPLIDRVRARLAADEKREVRPRSDSLWLRPFLRCGHCGGAMYGTATHGSHRLSYFRCGRYVKDKEVGKAPTCVNNRVYVSTVQDRLEDFLHQYGERVDYDLEQSDPRLAGLIRPLAGHGAALSVLRAEMRTYVLTRLPLDQHDLLGVEEGISLSEAYRYYHEQENASHREEVAKIVEEIRLATKALRRVDENSEAERLLLQDIRELEAKKAATEARAVPLDKRVNDVIAQLQEAKVAIRATARFAANRRTREAYESLGKVLNRVEVISRPSGTTGRSGTRGERFAERLVFYPISGDPITLEADPPKAAISIDAETRARELLHQGVNLNRICKVLDDEGYKPPKAARWTRSSLVKRLKHDLASLPPGARDGRKRPRRKGRDGTGAS
jgi:DNA invertase Pin-like site-specific DNA recombinase